MVMWSAQRLVDVVVACVYVDVCATLRWALVCCWSEGLPGSTHQYSHPVPHGSMMALPCL